MLFINQGLSMTSHNLTIIASILAAQTMESNLAYASLPFGLQYISSMISSFPARKFMAKMGNKGKKNQALAFGQAMGFLGGLISAYAIYYHIYPLFFLGAIFIGIHSSFWNFIGYAATEQAPPDSRNKVMSWVTAGGILAAFLGSFLAQNTRDALVVPYVGIYLALGAITFVNCLLLSFTPLSHFDKKTPIAPSVKFQDLFKDKLVALAMFLVIFSYMTMNSVMTASTVSMNQHHHDFNDIAIAIKYHVIAMFLPSFFTGALIDKFGYRIIIALGLVLYSISAYFHLSGILYFNHFVGLIFLGLGWNFLYVSGSALLANKIPTDMMLKAQAITAILTQLAQSLMSFSIGFWLDTIGWIGINLFIFVPLAVILALSIANHKTLVNA